MSFKYLDNVKIISGFHSGREGYIVNIFKSFFFNRISYLVILDSYIKGRPDFLYFKEKELELIKEKKK